MHNIGMYDIIYNIKIKRGEHMNSLKQGRLKKGVSQGEIANILGIKQNTFSDKENMKSKITIEEAFIIEEVLNIPIQELFKDWKGKR